MGSFDRDSFFRGMNVGNLKKLTEELKDDGNMKRIKRKANLKRLVKQMKGEFYF